MVRFEKLEGWRTCGGDEEAYVKGFLVAEAENFQRSRKVTRFVSGVIGALCLLSAVSELVRLKTAIGYADRNELVQHGAVAVACILTGLLFVGVALDMKKKKDRKYVRSILRKQLSVLDVRILAVHIEDFTHSLAEFCDPSGRECEHPLYLEGFDFPKEGIWGLCLDVPELKVFHERMIIPRYDADNAWCRRLVKYWKKVQGRQY